MYTYMYDVERVQGVLNHETRKETMRERKEEEEEEKAEKRKGEKEKG